MFQGETVSLQVQDLIWGLAGCLEPKSPEFCPSVGAGPSAAGLLLTLVPAPTSRAWAKELVSQQCRGRAAWEEDTVAVERERRKGLPHALLWTRGHPLLCPRVF
jgi:hypothetical protein